jgi:hypothetical protein
MLREHASLFRRELLYSKSQALYIGHDRSPNQDIKNNPAEQG